MKRPTRVSCSAPRPHHRRRPTPPSAASMSIVTPVDRAAAESRGLSGRSRGVNEWHSNIATVLFWGLHCSRMLSRKWLLVVFAMAFLSVLSQRCAAGPIKRRPPIVNIVDCTREFSFASPSPFPQSLPFLPSPTAVFHLDEVVLTHTIDLAEFRTRDRKASSATADIFQQLGWHQTCRLAPWLPRSY